jgi:hypothetical protein
MLRLARKRASKDRFKNKLAGEDKIATPLTITLAPSRTTETGSVEGTGRKIPT